MVLQLGVIVGVLIAFMFYFVGRKVSLRRFFYYTSIVLILISGGLLGYGVHELLEYAHDQGINLGVWEMTLFYLNLPSDSVWHEKGVIGSILQALIGYSSRMEVGRFVAQALYIAVVLPLTIYVYRKKVD